MRGCARAGQARACAHVAVLLACAHCSVQLADSAFLERQLQEKEELVAELAQAIEIVETRHAHMEAELKKAKAANRRLQAVIEAREEEIRKLKGVGEDDEVF